MGGKQSIQTPEEYQKSLDNIKAQHEQKKQDKITAEAAKTKQEEIKRQKRFKKEEDDANKNCKSYATRIVKLILETTLEKHMHNTLYFTTEWKDDSIDTHSYWSHIEGGADWWKFKYSGFIFEKMQFPCVVQEVRRQLLEYGFECKKYDRTTGFIRNWYSAVYFSVTKTHTIETTSVPVTQKIYVAPS